MPGFRIEALAGIARRPFRLPLASSLAATFPRGKESQRQWSKLHPSPKYRLADMRRPISICTVGLLLLGACTIEPIDDPGVGDLSLTSVVYAADGSVLAEFHASENRILVDYDQLPQSLIDAVVAIEDQRFWDHTGVDVQAVAGHLSPTSRTAPLSKADQRSPSSTSRTSS